MDVDPELLAVFRAEVEEQVDDLGDLVDRDPSRWRVERLFQIAHNVKGAARLVGADAIQAPAHALEDLLAAVRGGAELSEALASLVREGVELVEAALATLDGSAPPDVAGYRAAVDAFLGVEEPGTARGGADAAPAGAAEAAPDGGGGDGPAAVARTVRLDTARVDALMALGADTVALMARAEALPAAAGELTRRLAMLRQTDPAMRRHPQLAQVIAAARELQRQVRSHLDDAGHLTDELQASVRALRMARFDGLKGFAARTVREACRDTGVRAELVLEGGATEIDRAVLDQLRSPLVHVLRNAVAHGIEPAAERVAAGKSADGTIVLAARSAGAWVEVTVTDDGRGVDPARVRRRAVEAGVLDAAGAEALTEEEALELLFEGGFSTAETVTETAGRGVGLDVVRSAARQLGGSAAVRRRAGGGTVVQLRVPLTRLTTTGVLVRLGPQLYAIPTSEVERTLTVASERLGRAAGAPAVELEGGAVPLLDMASALGRGVGEAAAHPAIVVARGSQRRVVLVDEILGHREYVVQPLPWNLCGLPAVVGCAVIGGGRVVLVVDPFGARARGPQVRALATPGDRRQQRILVVDDSATSRTLERTILRTAGYDVVTAVDGAQAEQLLRREAVDLVVSDVEMPQVDGFELTRRIRREATTATLPVVLVTSLGSEEDRQRGADAGADAYIVKGAFDQDELLETIARLL